MGADFKAELERIRKVSDMLCSAHARLRDRFATQALAFDIVVLAASTWLLALTFVDPVTNILFSPSRIDPKIWLGILGAITFFATLVQIKTDWKGRSDSHKRSCEMYAAVKRECGYLIVAEKSFDIDECQRLLARYDMANDLGVPISEADFLSLKRHHKLKILVSKYLDKHPGAPVFLIRTRLLLKHSFQRLDDHQ